MLKKILFVLFAFTLLVKPQGKNILLFGGKNFYLWNAVTGSNLVTDTDVFLYGSFTKEKVPKDSLDDFGDGNVRAGTKSASKYMVMYLGSVFPYWENTGNQLIVNGNFDGNVAGWTGSDGTLSYYSTDADGIGRTGNAKFVTSAFLYPKIYRYGPNTFSAGTRYSIKLQYYLPSANVSAKYIIFRFANESTPITFSDYDQWIDTTFYYTPTTTEQLFGFRVGDITGEMHPPTAGDKFYADSCNVYEQILVGTADSVRTLARAISLDDLTEDTTYTYYCSVLQPNGRYSKGDDSTFTTPLRAPSNLNVIAGTNQSTITWLNNSVRDVYFEIWRKTLGSYTLLDTTSDVSYVDDGLSAGTTYYYKVRAKYTNYSDFTEEQSGTPLQPEIDLYLNPSYVDFGNIDSLNTSHIDTLISNITTTWDYDTSYVHTDSTMVIDSTGTPVAGGGNMLAIDFEEGTTLSTYFASTTASGDVTFDISTNAERYGSNGLRTVWNTTGLSGYGTKTWTSEDELWGQFKVYISGYDLGAQYKYGKLISLYNSTTEVCAVGIRSANSTAGDNWYYYISDSTGTVGTSTGTNFSQDAWHTIEYHYKKHSAAGQSDGVWQVWVDSTSIYSATNRNTTLDLTNCRFGGFTGGSSGITMTGGDLVYLDAWTQSNESRIPFWYETAGDTTWTYDTTYTYTDSVMVIDSTVLSVDTLFAIDTLFADSTVDVYIVNKNSSNIQVFVNSYSDGGLSAPFSAFNLQQIYIPANDSIKFSVRMEFNEPVNSYADQLTISTDYGTLNLPLSGTIFSSYVPPPDTIPPNAVSSFTATGTTTSHILNWSASLSGDVYKYLIYRGSLGVVGGTLTKYDSVAVGTTSKTYTLSEGTVYEYQIFAEDSVWNISTGSPKDSAVVETTGGEVVYGDNIWYLSTTSKGNASGTDWNNARAYTSMSTLAVTPGDTLLFDGGTSGLTYTSSFSLPFSGDYTHYVVYTAAKDAGHNGTVTISGTSDNITVNQSCVEVSGFNFAGGGGSHGYVYYSFGGSTATPKYHIRIKDCIFDVSGRAGIYMNYHPRYVEIIGNTFNQSPTSNNQVDCAFVRGDGAGYIQDTLIVVGNIFNGFSNVINSQHTDGLQTYHNQNIYIEGNIFNISNNKTQYAQVCYLEETLGKVYFLNNICYSNCGSLGTPIFGLPRQAEAGFTADSVYIIDNTFVGKQGRDANPYIEKVTNGLVLKNNVFVSYNSLTKVGLLTVTATITSDYNWFYHPYLSQIAGSYTFAIWQSAGRDAHGIDGTQPTFTNFNYGFSSDINTIKAYDFSMPTPQNGTFFSISFGGYTYTSDGKMGADQ